MGHYAAEMGPPPDFAAEYQQEQERFNTIIPFVEAAFLQTLSEWQANGRSGADHIKELFEAVHEAAKLELANANFDLPIYAPSDIRKAMYMLATHGYIQFDRSLKVTQLGYQRLRSQQQS